MLDTLLGPLTFGRKSSRRPTRRIVSESSVGWLECLQNPRSSFSELRKTLRGGGTDGCALADGRTPFFVAAENGRASHMRDFIRSGADPLVVHESTQWNILHAAVASGDIACLRALLNTLPPQVRATLLSQSNADGQTPLFLAFVVADLETVSALRSFVGTAPRDAAQRSVMHFACARGDLKLAEEALTIDPEGAAAEDVHGRSPLTEAVLSGAFAVVYWLVGQRNVRHLITTTAGTAIVQYAARLAEHSCDDVAPTRLASSLRLSPFPPAPSAVEESILPTPSQEHDALRPSISAPSYASGLASDPSAPPMASTRKGSGSLLSKIASIRRKRSARTGGHDVEVGEGTRALRGRGGSREGGRGGGQVPSTRDKDSSGGGCEVSDAGGVRDGPRQGDSQASSRRRVRLAGTAGAGSKAVSAACDDGGWACGEAEPTPGGGPQPTSQRILIARWLSFVAGGGESIGTDTGVSTQGRVRVSGTAGLQKCQSEAAADVAIVEGGCGEEDVDCGLNGGVHGAVDDGARRSGREASTHIAGGENTGDWGGWGEDDFEGLVPNRAEGIRGMGGDGDLCAQEGGGGEGEGWADSDFAEWAADDEEGTVLRGTPPSDAVLRERCLFSRKVRLAGLTPSAVAAVMGRVPRHLLQSFGGPQHAASVKATSSGGQHATDRKLALSLDGIGGSGKVVGCYAGCSCGLCRLASPGGGECAAPPGGREGGTPAPRYPSKVEGGTVPECDRDGGAEGGACDLLVQPHSAHSMANFGALGRKGGLVPLMGTMGSACAACTAAMTVPVDCVAGVLAAEVCTCGDVAVWRCRAVATDVRSSPAPSAHGVSTVTTGGDTFDRHEGVVTSVASVSQAIRSDCSYVEGMFSHSLATPPPHAPEPAPLASGAGPGTLVPTVDGGVEGRHDQCGAPGATDRCWGGEDTSGRLGVTAPRALEDEADGQQAALPPWLGGADYPQTSPHTQPDAVGQKHSPENSIPLPPTRSRRSAGSPEDALAALVPLLTPTEDIASILKFDSVPPLGSGASSRVWRARLPSQHVDAARVRRYAEGCVAATKGVRLATPGSVIGDSTGSEEGGLCEGRLEALRHIPSEGFAVAVKELRSRWFEHRKWLVVEELRALERLHHPHIVRYHGAWWCGNLWLAFELVRGGTVAEYIAAYSDKHRTPDDHVLGERRAAGVVKQVLSALVYTHLNGFLHRDLKADNVLVTENGDVQLTDFGIGATVGSGMSGSAQRLTCCGTPGFQAPEVLAFSGHSFPADVYGVGALAAQILTGRAPPPWAGEVNGVGVEVEHTAVASPPCAGGLPPPGDVPSNPVNPHPTYPPAFPYTPPLPPTACPSRTSVPTTPPSRFVQRWRPHLSADAYDFVASATQRSASARPSAAQLLLHPWLKRAVPRPMAGLVRVAPLLRTVPRSERDADGGWIGRGSSSSESYEGSVGSDVEGCFDGDPRPPRGGLKDDAGHVSDAVEAAAVSPCGGALGSGDAAAAEVDAQLHPSTTAHTVPSSTARPSSSASFIPSLLQSLDVHPSALTALSRPSPPPPPPVATATDGYHSPLVYTHHDEAKVAVDTSLPPCGNVLADSQCDTSAEALSVHPPSSGVVSLCATSPPPSTSANTHPSISLNPSHPSSGSRGGGAGAVVASMEWGVSNKGGAGEAAPSRGRRVGTWSSARSHDDAADFLSDTGTGSLRCGRDPFGMEPRSGSLSHAGQRGARVVLDEPGGECTEVRASHRSSPPLPSHLATWATQQNSHLQSGSSAPSVCSESAHSGASSWVPRSSRAASAERVVPPPVHLTKRRSQSRA